MIVTADDVGESRAVNDETFELVQLGKVHAVSVMANGEDLAFAIDFLKCQPSVRVGVHLNGAWGKPLRPKGLEPILDDDGRMTRQLVHLAPSIPLHRALYREWDAQIQRLVQAGLTVHHLDSHHHLHTHPPLLPIVLTLARQHGIRRIRLTKNLFLPAQRPSRLKRTLKRAWNSTVKHAAPQSADVFADYATIHALYPRVHSLGVRVEAMVHPGADLQEYRDEIQLLRGM